MDKEEIKRLINCDIECAWDNKSISTYYLERLPTCNGDWDSTVEDFRSQLREHIRTNNREYFDMTVDELVEWYHNNQDTYNL